MTVNRWCWIPFHWNLVLPKDLGSIARLGTWHSSLTSMWHTLIFLKSMVNENEFTIVMNLVSLNNNSNPRYLWNLAKVCMWLELVPPSLIGIFSVLCPLNDKDIPRMLKVITMGLVTFLDHAPTFEGWGKTTSTMVAWRHGYCYPTRNHCMCWFALPTFEWCIVKIVVNKEHLKHMCNNEIGLCAQNLDTTLGLVRWTCLEHTILALHLLLIEYETLH